MFNSTAAKACSQLVNWITVSQDPSLGIINLLKNNHLTNSATWSTWITVDAFVLCKNQMTKVFDQHTRPGKINTLLLSQQHNNTSRLKTNTKQASADGFIRQNWFLINMINITDFIFCIIQTYIRDIITGNLPSWHKPIIVLHNNLRTRAKQTTNHNYSQYVATYYRTGSWVHSIKLYSQTHRHTDTSKTKQLDFISFVRSFYSLE